MSASRVAEPAPRSRPGRPRSEASRAAVLRATSELLHEVGLRAMTTEEIANRSGASKATIYKWWPNKYAVAIEAFLSEITAESQDPDTGSARDDLTAVVRGLMHFYSGPSGRVFAQLVGEAQADPLVHRELRTNLVESRRDTFRAIWMRGVERGEFRADVDPDAALDVIIGPPLYRLLFGQGELTDAAADTLVDVAIRGLAAGD
ncbi:TetR family transcriptional regulator [Mycolicibacterium agri]|uniref:TetR family transcriptional regulator n=1 Tax=Mycolicibacterium agri TaxID=36811 RepID=A0A2A7MTB1_MYCAG|nr:TetR/AcrR family transcriptional regulator [Mycolicibacterium agri]PEG34955.1 TetR family transcriptional regulator [Mycolicibacterium agri]GFG53658.1 TetR family transcriptional regulator [Mycolicibacterium agri]